MVHGLSSYQKPSNFFIRVGDDDFSRLAGSNQHQRPRMQPSSQELVEWGIPNKQIAMYRLPPPPVNFDIAMDVCRKRPMLLLGSHELQPFRGFPGSLFAFEYRTETEAEL